MKVGLPGIGIGGVFYILLVLWMPVRELWLLAHGRSSRQRWRRIAVQNALAAMIVAALWGEWWMLAELPGLVAALLATDLIIMPLPPLDGLPAEAEAWLAADTIALEHMAPAVVATPFVIIAVLCAGVRLLHLFVRLGRRQPRMAAAIEPVQAA